MELLVVVEVGEILVDCTKFIQRDMDVTPWISTW